MVSNENNQRLIIPYDELIKRTKARLRDNEDITLDDVDKALRDIIRLKTLKFKSLELDKYLAEAEKEMKKLKEELKGESGSSSESSSDVEKDRAMLEFSKMLSGLSEEQRNAVVQTYAMLKQAEKGKADLLLLPLLIGYARANPSAGKNDMTNFANEFIKTMNEYAKVLGEQLKTGVEIAKSSQQPSQQSNPASNLDIWKDVLKTFTDLMRENIQKPLQDLAEKVQPHPSPLEMILLNDKLFERAKSLGLFGGTQQQSSTNPEISLEIEKLRTERDLKIKELEQQHQKMMLELQQQHQKWLTEQQLEDKKWDKIAQIFSGPLGKTIEKLGDASADKLRSHSSQELRNIKVERIRCPSCSKEFFVNALGDYAICPHCGSVLKRQGSEQQSSEQKPQGEKSEQGRQEEAK